jgi:hypothetical protein
VTTTRKNPNPWNITNSDAAQTSWQMTNYLFCGSCEQRLSKNGEYWVLRHCLRQDGGFKLLDIISKKEPQMYLPNQIQHGSIMLSIL